MEIHRPHAAKTWKEFLHRTGNNRKRYRDCDCAGADVEYFHHVNQLHTVRGELVAEIEQNQAIAARNAASFDKIRAALARDMTILRGGQASHGQIAAKFDYSWLFTRTRDGAWQAARQSGALELMPRDELGHYAFVYHAMDDFMAALNPATIQLEIAGAIARRAADGPLTARDMEELLTATSQAQGQMAFAERILHFEQVGLKRALLARLKSIDGDRAVCPLLMLWTALHQPASLSEASKMEESHGVCGYNRIGLGEVGLSGARR